jgi:hypothetical protein
MRKVLWKALLFVIGAVAVVLVFFRDLLMPNEAKHEAAKLNVDAKKEEVEAAKVEVKAAEADAAKVHESVAERLAKLEDEARKQHARDSVDVANDLIKGA